MKVNFGFSLFLSLVMLIHTETHAQVDCGWNPDYDDNGSIGVPDLLALLGVFEELDSDGDGIFDSQDDCLGVIDACGVCAGEGTDFDGDGICDDVDDCVGEYDLCGECNGLDNDIDGDGICDLTDPCVGYYDECGVCNGPGPIWPIIDSIIILTDSVYIQQLQEWYVFEYGSDTTFVNVCIDSDCLTYSGTFLQSDSVVSIFPDTLNICLTEIDELFYWNSLGLLDSGWEALSLVRLSSGYAYQVNLMTDDSWEPVGGDYTYELTNAAGLSCLGLLHVNASVTPEASFTAAENQCANSFTVENTSSGGYGTVYSWDFGDGSSILVAESPSHSYSVALPEGDAAFEVLLNATSWNGACSSTAVRTVTVIPVPVPDFSFAPPLCQDDDNWPDYSLVLPPYPFATDWHLDWGNGTDTSFSAPSFANPPGTTYEEFGIYDITLTVEAANGCSNTIIEEVFVGSSPTIGTANPGNTVGLCSPADLVFPITDFINNVEWTTYTVDFGDGVSTQYNHPPPSSVSHTYGDDSCGETTPEGSANALRFKVTASNACGTSITTHDPIRLHGAPNPHLSGPELVCTGVYPYQVSGNGVVVNESGCEPSDVYWTIETIEGAGTGFASPGVGTAADVYFYDAGLYEVQVYDLHLFCEDGQDTLEVCVMPEPVLDPWYELLTEQATNTIQFNAGLPELVCGSYDLEWSIMTGEFLELGHISGSESFSFEFPGPGVYFITLNASLPGGGCLPFEQFWEVELN